MHCSHAAITSSVGITSRIWPFGCQQFFLEMLERIAGFRELPVFLLHQTGSFGGPFVIRRSAMGC